MNRTIWLIRAACAFGFCAASLHAATIASLGPVDETLSTPQGQMDALPSISGDGSTVAFTSGRRGFTWTAATGRVPLGGVSDSSPAALSYDGSVVVGQTADSMTWQPTRWVNNTPSTLYISGSMGFVTDVSADGSAVVGHSFKWKDNSVWNLSVSNFSRVRGISDDGRIIVGTAGSRACLWQDWTVTDLGSLTTDAKASSVGTGISPDGKVAFGYSTSNTLYREAFRWTAEEGMVGLGAAPGWGTAYDSTWMHASNADGSVIVGTAYHLTSPSSTRAVIWDAEHGIRFLDDVLTTDYGMALKGWTLARASGISEDGLTIVGYGGSPQGTKEGWIVTIPEPASLLLLFAGLALTGRRSRG